MRRTRSAVDDPRFPGFTEITEIGVGSLATVYRARESGTNRLVALKRLNVRDASARAVESFERESLALGAVGSHPNIVTLYRSFRATDGRPVLVLELCAGSIADRIRDGAGLPVPEVVALGIKIAGALETAHRAGILHRDVKPQNILITEFGEPALADFGVAMLQSATQTATGLFDFTTLHAAPELLEGGPTSAATDVYELASSLYQLVAGRSAFRAFDGESPASVILRILRDPVQGLVDSRVPAQLSDLLVQAMSKDLGGRPQTAAEFASGLATVEVDEKWSRTQFLIRDDVVSGSERPITRMPTPLPVTPAPVAAAPAVIVPALATAWSPVTIAGRRWEPEPADVRQVVLERVIVERVEWVPSDPSSQRELPPESPDELDSGGLLDSFWAEPEPAQYPIPPVAAGVADATAADFRQPLSRAGRPVREPAERMVLRWRATTLVADDDGLVSRRGLRRQVIPWADVEDFEQRFDGSPWSAGQLVAITSRGPVDLPATRGLAVELRRVQAELKACRQRAISRVPVER